MEIQITTNGAARSHYPPLTRHRHAVILVAGQAHRDLEAAVAPAGAAVRAGPDLHAGDVIGAPQIHKPPRGVVGLVPVGQRVGAGAAIVVVVACVAVHSAAGVAARAAQLCGALLRLLALRHLRHAAQLAPHPRALLEDRHLAQRQDLVGTGQRHPHVASRLAPSRGGQAQVDGGGGVGDVGKRVHAGVGGGGGDAVNRRHQHLESGDAARAAVSAVPDLDKIDVLDGAQVHAPPGASHKQAGK